VGDIVSVYRSAAGAAEIRKVDAAGTTIRWTNTVADGYGNRIAIDATDHIYVGAITYNGASFTFSVEKFAP
jgi:hypothetical protein